MRVSSINGEHLLVLNAQESSLLVDACMMLFAASRRVESAKLPKEMDNLLAGIFTSLASDDSAEFSHRVD